MIKLAVFDLDGTLVNSIEDLADACNKALEVFDFPIHSLEEYKYFLGDGVRNLISRAMPEEKRSERTIDEVHAIFKSYYEKNYINKTTAYDGIPRLLSELKKAGLILAVASNKPDEFTKKVVEKLFEEDTFEIAVGNVQGVAHKPDPEIVFRILSELNIGKEQAVFIGDTDVDIKTGKNAGLKTIGCLWGFREINELLKAGADFIASHPLDILNYPNFNYGGEKR